MNPDQFKPDHDKGTTTTTTIIVDNLHCQDMIIPFHEELNGISCHIKNLPDGRRAIYVDERVREKAIAILTRSHFHVSEQTEI